jgi:hypothetical protein
MRHVLLNREDEGLLFGTVEEPSSNPPLATNLCGLDAMPPVDHPHGRPVYEDGRQRVLHFGQQTRMLDHLSGQPRRPVENKGSNLHGVNRKHGGKRALLRTGQWLGHRTTFFRYQNSQLVR